MNNLLTAEEITLLQHLEQLLRTRNELQTALINGSDYLEKKELYSHMRNWIDERVKTIIELEIR